MCCLEKVYSYVIDLDPQLVMLGLAFIFVGVYDDVAYSYTGGGIR